MAFFSRKDPNRERLIRILSQIRPAESPPGWTPVISAAAGGLDAVGFSKKGPYLLVLSSQGRGVFDCESGRRIARDPDPDGDWRRESELLCAGLGPIEDELIAICGRCGGGLLHQTRAGESIELAAPRWPITDLYFCHDHKSALIDGHAAYCCRLEATYLEAYGFSWCGRFLVAATGSDFTLWKRG